MLPCHGHAAMPWPMLPCCHASTMPGPYAAGGLAILDSDMPRPRCHGAPGSPGLWWPPARPLWLMDIPRPAGVVACCLLQAHQGGWQPGRRLCWWMRCPAACFLRTWLRTRALQMVGRGCERSCSVKGGVTCREACTLRVVGGGRKPGCGGGGGVAWQGAHALRVVGRGPRPSYIVEWPAHGKWAWRGRQ